MISNSWCPDVKYMLIGITLCNRFNFRPLVVINVNHMPIICNNTWLIDLILGEYEVKSVGWKVNIAWIDIQLHNVHANSNKTNKA